MTNENNQYTTDADFNFLLLINFIEELKNTTSIKNKQSIIKKYIVDDFIRKVLFYTYNSFKQYYVTSDNCKKLLDRNIEGKKYTSVFDLLDDLSDRVITGHEAVHAVNELAKTYPVVYDIVDKDLKCRIGASLINKVVNLIPTFDVALANVYEPKLVNILTDDWYISHKIDGCVDYDTLVEFEDGKKIKIGEVVDNKIHGNIKSFNHQTNKIEYKPILNFMKNIDDINDSSDEWFEIELDNGNKLQITGNDTVYLPEINIYRRVDQLQGNESIYFD